MHNIEKRLIQFVLFLIPTNLALHWYTQDAYLNGRLIDYLLPKIYLSDFAILGLFIFYVFNIYIINGHIRNIHTNVSGRDILKVLFQPLVLFFIYALLRSTFTPLPLSSLVYVIKFIWVTMFGYFLFRRTSRGELHNIATLPLSLSLILQNSLAIAQFIKQKSIFNYLFFGEPDLSSTGISYLNLFHRLYIAPYGTTPHPNVLAGFIVITVTLLIITIGSNWKKWRNNILPLIAISLSLPTIILTGSMSTIIAISLCLTLILSIYYISSHRIHMIFLAIIISTPIISMIMLSSEYHTNDFSDNRSISVRYELNQAAINTIATHPWFGIGPNLFPIYLPQTTMAGQKALFLQPVHNVYLLILAETGIIGLILVFLTFVFLFRHHSGSIIKVIPLLILLIIGSLDHYPLTLQTGQLLLVLSIVLAMK